MRTLFFRVHPLLSLPPLRFLFNPLRIVENKAFARWITDGCALEMGILRDYGLTVSNCVIARVERNCGRIGAAVVLVKRWGWIKNDSCERVAMDHADSIRFVVWHLRSLGPTTEDFTSPPHNGADDFDLPGIVPRPSPVAKERRCGRSPSA